MEQLLPSLSGMKVLLPDWLAAVRSLQASIGTTLSQPTFQYKSSAAKSWKCEGKQQILSDTTHCNGWALSRCSSLVNTISRAERPNLLSKLNFVSERLLCAKQNKGRWAPVLGHTSAATVTRKWLFSLSSSFVFPPVQLQWRRLGPSLWWSEDSWSLEDREQCLSKAILTGMSHTNSAMFRLVLALF